MTTFDRRSSLRRLRDEHFDVLVIGGGITGCGVALDAAARGLTVALVERDDFASGTSSKSSKLVHGGLRYLQQKEYLLVYENLHERQRLLRNAPHLVEVLPFLIPVFGKDGVANKTFAKAISTALWLYDLTGGVRIGKRHDRISREEALAHLPCLRAERLVDAFLYYDARADDARLTLTIARTAAALGATCVNHAGVERLLHENGRAAGAVLAGDGCDGLEVRAGVVVNAAGVWADDVRALDEQTHPDSLRPAKGVHLTVPAARLPCDIAAVVTAADRRSVFVVPWGSLTYLGTTDTDYDGPLDDPQCTPEDVAYLLDTANRWMTSALTPGDVVGTWAGLRPLVKGAAVKERTKDLSRRHLVATSPTGVVSVTGGKLTTYRKMAADAVDAAVGVLGRGSKRSRTARLALLGAPGLTDPERELRLAEPLASHLARRYGTEATALARLITEDPRLAIPLVAGLPDVRAEVVHAARAEMATTVDDVLARRTRLRLQARDASVHAAEVVAALLASELAWSDDERAAAVDAYAHSVEHERTAAELPVTVLPGAVA